MIELLLAIMLRWPAPADETEPDRVGRLRELATEYVRACERYAPAARIEVDACAVDAAITGFWESANRYDVHAGERKGPGGEECTMQIHPAAQSVPDPKWRPFPPGTLAGLENTRRCIDSGVRLLIYHSKRCGVRSRDSLFSHAIVFSEYHQPADCKMLRGNSLARARHAQRTLASLRQAAQKENGAHEGRRLNLFFSPGSEPGLGSTDRKFTADHDTRGALPSIRGSAACTVSTL